MNERDKEYEKRLRERERRRQQRRKEVLKQRILLGTVGGLLAVILVTAAVSGAKKASKAAKEQQKKAEAVQKAEEKAKKAEEAKKDQDAVFTISAAGDCTLGTDENFDYETGFTGKYDAVQDPSYFFKEVKSIFEADDLTIVNMEGTLTEEETRADKLYAFKASPEYAKILTEGDVETVNLANNHTYDYGEKSYTDTIAALDAEGIISFGNDRTAIIEIQGIKVGLLGTYELRDHMGCEQEMKDNIANLKEQGAQLIIATFHWGEERENIPNETQVSMAAKRTSANSDSSQNFRLIPNTNLTKFDSGLKNRRQILYQLTEVNSSVCREIKQNFVVIKGVFHIYQFHIQAVFSDFFQTDTKSFLFLFPIGFFLFVILGIGNADNLF